jgi:hypothetical protein
MRVKMRLSLLLKIDVSVELAVSVNFEEFNRAHLLVV